MTQDFANVLKPGTVVELDNPDVGGSGRVVACKLWGATV